MAFTTRKEFNGYMNALITAEIVLREEAWLSLNPFRIFKYYKDLFHRRKCAKCRKAHTKILAKLAGIAYYE